MSDTATVQAMVSLDAPPADLPAGLRAKLNGELQGRMVIAWSQFDLDEHNRFTQRYAVLTDQKLHVFGDGQNLAFPIAQIQEAKTVEGLGVDRLSVVVDGKLAAELRYSRRFRRDMTRLSRKLERRLPTRDTDASPDWLDAVEREAEKREHCPKCGELIPAYAEGVCPQCLAKRKILWRLLDIASPYRWQMRWALILTMVWTGLMALGPILLQQMIDRAIMPTVRDAITHRPIADSSVSTVMQMHQMGFWAGLLIALILASELCSGVRLRLLAMLGTQITADLRHLVYSHLHDLSLRYFSKRRTGSLITRVTNDTDRLWDFIVFGSVDLVRDVAMIVLFAGCMFWMNWRLTLIALIPLPPLAYLTYRRGMKMQRLFGRLWTYWSRLTAVVGDALPGVKVVKAFANEQKEVDRFDARSIEFREKEREIHRVWTTLSPMVSGIMRFGGLMVWIVGGAIVIRNPTSDITVGTLVAFGSFVWQFYQPIMELANSNRMVTRAATSAQRIFEVLDTPPEIYSRDGAITKDRIEGRVEFRHVAFSYEGAQPALRDVSLAVSPGEMIGLCGPSGAGKSTFVNLICRFYDPTDGQILIDGVDIRDYDVRWLRRQVGIVLQEPYLFHGTVAENIRYGNDSAKENEIIRAAKAANAHDFIVGFPDGYDTMVGERGQSLSGGERQRISIARAILHNPRILILDEATSSVDSETEKQIQQALDRLVEGRTTFAIAHRLSTLTAADRLVVLDKGKVVEQGQHSELVHKPNGVYAKLHQTQMEMASLVAIR
jgi:ATP-binding cassette subfamily B protein